MFEDLKPKKINLTEWSHQFRKISDQIIKKYKYYGNQDWGIYLSPPATFMVYGARQLKRLKFDNSFAALRLWGFVFNESERLFRAKQVGKKVIATMGDLGTIPVIVMSFPDCIPFYPECIWWTPFFNESFILLDMATKLGAPEPACFSRAALAAFYKKAYFPKPDLIFASTGASCDDYSCIMQLIEGLGYNPIWIEIPFRRKSRSYFVADDYEEIHNGKRIKMGIQGAIDHILGVHKTYPDIKLTIDQQFSEDDYVITCFTMQGTHSGEWMGIKPTNKRINVTGVNVDRLKEEKERGITIDIGFAYWKDDVTILDVPGHERFIRNIRCR